MLFAPAHTRFWKSRGMSVLFFLSARNPFHSIFLVLSPCVVHAAQARRRTSSRPEARPSDSRTSVTHTETVRHARATDPQSGTHVTRFVGLSVCAGFSLCPVSRPSSPLPRDGRIGRPRVADAFRCHSARAHEGARTAAAKARGRGRGGVGTQARARFGRLSASLPHCFSTMDECFRLLLNYREPRR